MAIQKKTKLVFSYIILLKITGVKDLYVKANKIIQENMYKTKFKIKKWAM